MKILLKSKTFKSNHTTVRTSAHRLQAVAPPQLEVAPPAVTCCKRLHRSSQRCNRPQLCPFITQAMAGGETDPNSFPSLLYSPKPPPSPFPHLSIPNTLHFEAKHQHSFPLLKIPLLKISLRYSLRSP